MKSAMEIKTLNNIYFFNKKVIYTHWLVKLHNGF